MALKTGRGNLRYCSNAKGFQQGAAPRRLWVRGGSGVNSALIFIGHVVRQEIPLMSLQKEDVEKIAHLARLAIDEADIPGYAHNLSSILDLVARMDSVDTEAVTPMAHPLDMPQRLRADEVTEENQRERFQAIAPQVENGLYLVPQVIE